MKNAVENLSGRRPVPQWLERVALGLLLYPLAFLAGLYAEFFMAWALLGHRPWPVIDDPKYINGSSWLHPIVLTAGAGLFPVFLAAIAFNVIYMVKARPAPGRLAGRVLGFVFMWVAALVVFGWDPGRVMEWWLD